MGNSGLLDRVLPGYTDEKVRPLLVGSGRALDMLARGAADAIISHAPEIEAAKLQAHPSWYYRKILFNDFLVVGPLEDPARAAQAADVVDAMRRITRSTAPFLSRGDASGTHERERELWAAAGIAPESGRLVIAGAGMGQTLRIADGTGAYTLTDRGTWEALSGSLRLRVISEGDERLLNTYAVIADSGNARGLAFARWLSENTGRDLLEDILASGAVKGFSVWPRDAENLLPGARPR
jgi:tungstate transport system substrate-binding protein